MEICVNDKEIVLYSADVDELSLQHLGRSVYQCVGPDVGV
jgi:hypothetical protein